MNVWAAGKLALAGEPGAAYDYARHYAVQAQALHYAEGQEATYFGWHYPPSFMLVAALLALLPYGAALAAWMARDARRSILPRSGRSSRIAAGCSLRSRFPPCS